MKVTADEEMFDELFSGIADAVYDVVIVFDKENQRMDITVADPATVQMIDLSVPASSFKEFDIDVKSNQGYQEDEEHEALYIGVNAENFYSMISELSGDITLTTDKNKLVISDGDNEFAMTTLNIDIDEDIPPFDSAEMDLSTSFKLSVDDLKDARKKAEIISDEVCVEVLPEEGIMRVHTASDNNSLETEVEVEDLEGEAVESRFPLSYISDVEKYLKGLSSLDGKVDVKIGDEQPIMFNADTDRETLETLVAPILDGPMSS